MTRTQPVQIDEIKALADKCMDDAVDLRRMCDRLDKSFGPLRLRESVTARMAQQVNALAHAVTDLNGKLLAMLAIEEDANALRARLLKEMGQQEEATP